VETQATCVLRSGAEGFEITRMLLDVRVDVSGIDQAALESIAVEAHQSCSVSNLLREGLIVELMVTFA
jgi:organic hydroperoxide reductase OsmC/OhrA